MEITTLGIAGLALLLFGVLGYLRDTRRNLLTLVATLLGVLLVENWVPVWSTAFTAALDGGNKGTVTMALSVITLLLTLAIVGYGAVRLLPRAVEPPTARARLVNTTLGVINGALVAGYLVRYLSASETVSAGIKGFAPLMFLLDYQRWFLLGPVLLVLALIIISTVSRLIGGKPQPIKPLPGAGTTGGPRPPGGPSGGAGAGGAGSAPRSGGGGGGGNGRINLAQVADRVRDGVDRAR